ncbi:MAG: hypothetical protein ACI4HI_08010 [Lachnospiraceae bacterium]
MNITGIRVTDEFYQYNNKKQKEERVQRIRLAKKEQRSANTAELCETHQDAEVIKRAIIDMQRDEILKQYQVFVSQEK